MKKLLIVDDNPDIRKQLKWGMGKDFNVLLAGDAREAIQICHRERPAVITLDLGLPPHVDSSEEGFRCLDEILRIVPAAKVIVITGNEGRENAVRAVQMGAYDFYQKPIDLNELRVIVNRAFHLSTIEDENRRLHAAVSSGPAGLTGMIGHCGAIEKVFATIRKVAPFDASVLICGESGTGKEMVARSIHALSERRSKGAFVAINCGAIPENLLESELFGHEKGAFTGAQSRVLGKVEYADGGTLFLDEIGELPVTLQVKILRFLQEKVIQRVGGREDIPVDVRIVAATNVDISQAIQEGRFREDLYYRLGVVTLSLPPLRHRGGDILVLANHFLQTYRKTTRKRVRGFSERAIDFLQGYDWPGNVRELENKVQRAVLMAEGMQIEPEDLGFFGEHVPRETLGGETTLREARDRVERELIGSVISSNRGNIARAAEQLGVSRPTLYDLMKKHGMST